jgi:hypothetical protein
MGTSSKTRPRQATPVSTAQPVPTQATLPALSAKEAVAPATKIVVPRPVFRKLRVFAVDPDVGARFEVALINEMTLKMPFETLKPGPSGEYISVVDVDEHGQLVHPPLNLDRPDLLAQDGLPVSDSALAGCARP